MLKNIDGTKIHIEIINQEFEMTEEITQRIKTFWEKVQKENPNLWDGELTCVEKYEKKDNDIFITCKKSHYSHYLYDERIGDLPEEYYCSSIAAGCLLETSDGYFVVGELAEHTSFPHCMQLSGGNVDKSDMEFNKLDISKTIIRECKEELNIDLTKNEQVESFKIKYINLPDIAHQYIFIAIARLKYSKEEVEIHYKQYVDYLKENNLEIEFGKLHFIKRESVVEELNKMDNPKRDYLAELLRLESMT